MKTNKQELILEILEDEGTVSTTRISDKIKANNFTTKTLLEDLLKQKKVKRIQFKNMTFWELKP